MSEPTFQQLTDQVRRLTQRVAALERELGLRRTAEEPSAPTARAQEEPPETEAPSQILASPVAAPEEPARDLESSVGLKLVNRVGAVTFILGIAFFFRYAIENNWIGETTRVLLGALAGLLLLAGGDWAFRRGQRIFAQGITGAGVAALYLSCYAANREYHLVQVPATLAMATAVTVVAAYLALRYGSQAIAALALLGGLLAPNLLGQFELGAWLLPFYVAVLDAGFLRLTSRRGWRFTEWAALAGTVLFSIDFGQVPLRWFLPVYYLIFATTESRSLFFASHLLLLGRSAAQTNGMYWPNLIGMSAAGLGVIRRRAWYPLTALMVTTAGLFWLYRDGFKSYPGPGVLFSLTLLFSMFLGFTIWRALEPEEASLDSSELVAFVLTPAFYFGACFVKLNWWAHQWSALQAVLLAALYFSLAYRWRNRLPNTLGLLSAGIAISFFTLAIPIEFHAFRVTVAWGLEGAALLWVAARRGAAAVRLLGLLVLLIAGLHFASVDLTMYANATDHAGLLNARLVTALLLSIALFLGAWWSRTTEIPAWVPALGGHLVLLAGLSVEISDWAKIYHPQNQTSAESAAISVLFAAYAVVLIAIGTRMLSVGSRYMGLALIALVVIKLYLYDVWQLDLVYRFIAFAALGALLLTVSFLYSRYRESVAGWLKSPPAASEAHPPPPPE